MASSQESFLVVSIWKNNNNREKKKKELQDELDKGSFWSFTQHICSLALPLHSSPFPQENFKWTDIQTV